MFKPSKMTTLPSLVRRTSASDHRPGGSRWKSATEPSLVRWIVHGADVADEALGNRIVDRRRSVVCGDRGLAAPLQRRAPAQLAQLSTASAGNYRRTRRTPCAMGERASCWRRALAQPQDGVSRPNVLTLNSDHPSGQAS